MKIKSLSYKYAMEEEYVLRGINLEIFEGDFVVIAGPTGGGKSTLCRCMVGLIPHFYSGEMEGSVEVFGRNIRETSTPELSRTIGMVLQNPMDQLVAMSVEREVAFGPENLGLPRKELRNRVEESLLKTKIYGLRDRNPLELSAGQLQKVAIASILAMKPKILILDEPTSELDPKSAIDIFNLLKELNNQGITIILIEHRLEHAINLVNRLIIMDEGKIVLDGDPRSVLSTILESKDMEKIGVSVPKISVLAKQLMDAGISISKLPLTTKELVALLGDFLAIHSL